MDYDVCSPPYMTSDGLGQIRSVGLGLPVAAVPIAAAVDRLAHEVRNGSWL